MIVDVDTTNPCSRSSNKTLGKPLLMRSNIDGPPLQILFGWDRHLLTLFNFAIRTLDIVSGYQTEEYS
jgi:hypothetical protein